jgi:hypothetical protein
LKSVLGQLILGGYDLSRFTKSPFAFSLSEQDARPLTVGVQSVTAINTLQGTISFTSSGYLADIDSTVSHLWLPKDVCDAFENAFGLTYDNTTGLYLVNDTIHSQLKAANPTITFKLGNTAYDTGNYTNIELPYAAFDLQASYPYYQNSTNYFPIRRTENETRYVLGRTFLQEAYLIVDYERKNFSIAQAAFIDPQPSPQVVVIPPLVAPASSTPHSGSRISHSAIGGIVAGVICVFTILAAAFWLYHRRTKARLAELQKKLDSTNEVKYTSEGCFEMHGNGDPSELVGTEMKVELWSPDISSLASPTFKDGDCSEMPTPTRLSSPFLHEVEGSPVQTPQHSNIASSGNRPSEGS